MAERRKESPKPSISEDSDVCDSPLPTLRSIIPTHPNDLQGFQIMDRTVLDPRTSVESDASDLSYPSREPSLLDHLRTSLSQGADINKILNKKKHQRDMTIHFPLTGSPGSLNSSADVTLSRLGRQANVLARKKKSNMTLNFTMNDTDSSCDNQENESPVLGNHKPVFKKPFARKMSIRIDDIPDSDSPKNTAHDDSLPTLDTKRRPPPLRSSRSRFQHEKNMTFDISLDSSADSEKSMEQVSLNDAGPSLSSSNYSENDPLHSKVSVLPIIDGICVNSPKDYPVQNNDCTNIEKKGNASEFDATFTSATVPHCPVTTFSCRKSVGLLSEETGDDGTPETTKKSCHTSADKRTYSVFQPQHEESLTDSVNRPTISKLDEEPSKWQHSNKLERRKNRFSVNFTLSDTASTDSMTSPNILERPTEPMLKTKSNKISIPLSVGDDKVDDTLPNTTHVDDQEGDGNVDEDLDCGDASLFPTLASSESHEANNTSVPTPLILDKHANPLAKHLGRNKVSIPYTRDDKVTDDGLPNIGTTDDQRQFSEAHPPNTDNVNAGANDDGSTSFLLPSNRCVNPLGHNTGSILCQLKDTVIDSELSNNGKTSDNDILDCVIDASEHPENINASNSNTGDRNLEISVSDVASYVTHSSDALSLGFSVDDMPQSSNDYSCDSFKGSREISLQPQETSNVSKGICPSIEGHPGVAFSPESNLSSDELHLELSLNESLQYSGMDSSVTSIKSKPHIGAIHTKSLLEIDNAEAAKDTNHSEPTSVSQDPPAFSIKSPPLLKRSKRGSKNVTVGVDSSASQASVSDVSGFLKKSFKTPLKTKSTLKKISIALADETNDSSSLSESGTRASCGCLANALVASAQKTGHFTSTTNEVEVDYDVASDGLHPTESLQDQNDWKSLSACQSGCPSNNTRIDKNLDGSEQGNTFTIIAEPPSSSRTRKDGDEPLFLEGTKPEVLAKELNDGKPIKKEMDRSTRGLSEYSEKINETYIGRRSAAVAKDSAADEILPLPINVNIVRSTIASVPPISQEAKSLTSGHHVSDDDSTVGVIAVTDTTPNIVDGIIGNGPNSDQLRSSIDPPVLAVSNIRKPSPSIRPSPSLDDHLDASHHTITAVELVHLPSVVSPGVAIPYKPEKHASYQGTPVGEVGDDISSCPSTGQAVQTTATSIHLNLTTFDNEAGDATDLKPCHTATHLTPAREAVALPLEQPVPKNSSGANGISVSNEPCRSSIPAPNKTDPNTVPLLAGVRNIELLEGRGKPVGRTEPHHDITTQGTEHPSKQEVSSDSVLQQTVQHNTLHSGKPLSLCDFPTLGRKNTGESNCLNALILNTLIPKPASESIKETASGKQGNDFVPAPIPKVGPSGISVREPAVPGQSKRKSVSFKPSSENLYHSPPDHASLQYQDQNADGRTQVDNGYDFSQIQMTTDISKIEPASSAKKGKRHVTSTPISKPKTPSSPSKMSAQHQSLESAKHTKHQFLAPPVQSITKRVSVQPVPEIIPPLIPDPQVEAGSVGAGSQGSSESGYDLSSENSLEISAIPKDGSTSKWRGTAPLFHSTPLHRTKVNTKKLKKKSPVEPVSLTSEEQAKKRVLNHSVQTSRNLRSRSKTSIESGSTSEPLSRSASGSLRRSTRRNPTPVATAPKTLQSGGNEPSGGELIIGSPANGIAIKDNTILSTRIESHSRAKGSRTRSTAGSAFNSYDSHRKMTSRRLFNNEDEIKSSTDASYPSEETTQPDRTTEPPSDDVALMSWQENGVPTAPAEPSISHNDGNISLVSDQHDNFSDNDSVVSGVSTGSSSSTDNGVVMRQSFESQLSSIRYRSKQHSKQRAESHHEVEPPKPRSKFAIRRTVPASGLDLIFPVDVPARKRRRTTTTVKLFNPGAKWKKSKQLYAWLKKKLEPEYKLYTNIESERLVLELDHARKLVSQGHKQGVLDSCIERLMRLKLCRNQLQLWGFFMKFMPYDFVREVVPMGGAFGKPFDEDHPVMAYDPILLQS